VTGSPDTTRLAGLPHVKALANARSTVRTLCDRSMTAVGKKFEAIDCELFKSDIHS
jgi:hypothetical protein